MRLNRFDQALELEKELVSRMPWLARTFAGKNRNYEHHRSLSTLTHLIQSTRDERKAISKQIKHAWKAADDLRWKLNDLVREFCFSDSRTRKTGILAE